MGRRRARPMKGPRSATNSPTNSQLHTPETNVTTTTEPDMNIPHSPIDVTELLLLGEEVSITIAGSCQLEPQWRTDTDEANANIQEQGHVDWNRFTNIDEKRLMEWEDKVEDEQRDKEHEVDDESVEDDEVEDEYEDDEEEDENEDDEEEDENEDDEEEDDNEDDEEEDENEGSDEEEDVDAKNDENDGTASSKFTEEGALGNESPDSDTTTIVMSNVPRPVRVRRPMPPASIFDSLLSPSDYDMPTPLPAANRSESRLDSLDESNGNKKKKGRSKQRASTGQQQHRQQPSTHGSSSRSSLTPAVSISSEEMRACLGAADGNTLARYITNLNAQHGVPNLSLAPLRTPLKRTNSSSSHNRASRLPTRRRRAISQRLVADSSSDEDVISLTRNGGHERRTQGNPPSVDDSDRFRSPQPLRTDSPINVESNGNNDEEEGSDADSSPSQSLRSGEESDEMTSDREESSPSPPPLLCDAPSPPPPLNIRKRGLRRRSVNENAAISAASGRLPEHENADNQRVRSAEVSPDPGLGEDVPLPDHRLFARRSNRVVRAAIAGGAQVADFRPPRNLKPITPRNPNLPATPRKALTDADRPYKCRKCPAAFTRKDNYRRHKQEKHNAVPQIYHCPYCGALFCSKRNQDVHIRSRHLDRRTFYECSHCGLRFLNRGTKHSHERICTHGLQREEQEEE